jgi:hypothetical protein
MAETISEYIGVLVVKRCWCGIQHAVPKSLIDQQQREMERGDKQTGIFCPLGHNWICAGKSDAERLREQIASERASHDQTKAELRETERRRRAEKGAKTKLRKRVAAGVCPCCNRHFGNVQRHIEHMHPEFVSEAKAEQA